MIKNGFVESVFTILTSVLNLKNSKSQNLNKASSLEKRLDLERNYTIYSVERMIWV